VIGSPLRTRLRAETVTRWERFLARSPVQPLFRWRASRELAVIAYHGIDDPESFARHLDKLRTRCSPVSLDEVCAAIESRAALPRRAVLITFDDADRTLVDHGLGLMTERGLPGVAFVVAGHLDGDRPFWWKEVEDLVRAGGTTTGFEGRSPLEVVGALKRIPDDRRHEAVAELRRTAKSRTTAFSQLRRADLPMLRSAGIEVGNHTMTHPILPYCSEDRMHEEITTAHEILEAVMGAAPTAFAYPNGDWDPRGERVLRELSYRAGFLFDHALVRPPVRHPLRISRVRVDSTASVERLLLILSGFHPALHHLRRRLTRGRVR
jgi:peptidoglycan/xylan/chitin deacetylase (PgdA/CDA1 family)